MPEEKGGGTFTYRILNKQKFCAATIHILDEGIDSGKILLKSKKEKLLSEALPINYLKKTNIIYKSLIKKFVKKIISNSSFNLKNQNFAKGFYLPRFYTDISGVINWSWSGKNIDLFIKACSRPYPGAFCFMRYKNKNLKIKIYNSRFEKKNKFIHPWLIGKIFYEDSNIFKVYVVEGVIIIRKKDIKFEKNILIKKFIGKTLFNYSNDITKSISHIPNIFNYK